MALLAGLAFAPLDAVAQGGQIVGTVRHSDSGEPIPSVQISLEGTTVGVLGNADGSFVLTNLPPGTHALVARRLGFSLLRQGEIVVTDGASVTVNLVMRPQVLALQEIVATGLVDPVEGVLSPIAVSRVSREMLPVTVSGNAIQNLQGMVPGLTVNRLSGQPGEGVTMMLRTPTSIRGTGAPLIVVDGVILGGENQSTTDIESLDIESFEVIRGAAASSLYGSRAAAGVIAITTRRGSELSFGQTRLSARTEIGFSQALEYDYLSKHHHYLMDPTNSFYVNAQGVQVDRNNRVSPVNTLAFTDKPYPGPIYNNVDAISQPGAFRANSVSISGNAAETNFAVSLNNQVEEGALANNDGYYRNSFRINLDHRFQDNLSLSVSLYHSRDGRDELQGNPFNLAVSAPLDVDFSAKGPDGQYLQQPDPTISVQNPLWTQASRESYTRNNRTLASGGLTWTPVSWMSARGQIGYDRSDGLARDYVPKGTPANVGNEGELDGSLSINNSFSDTYNLEGELSFRRDFGRLNVRTSLRGIMEYDHDESGTRSGSGFVVFGVPTLGNIASENRNATTSESDRRALGYLWDTAFDFNSRYVFTILGRRDGSSLFGEAERWHTYYRVAGAWRMGEEDWFNVPHVSEC
jgi:TonB-dependent SusC/RagA subfamily outer membrane receptor